MTPQQITIEYQTHEPPSTPLNLRFGVIYRPRKRDEFCGAAGGYSCEEIQRGYFTVSGWGRGRVVTLWEGDDLARAFAELATMLGMTK